METARCQCPHGIDGKRFGVHPSCAIHGWSSPHPRFPYALTEPDRRLLKSFRIAISDSAEIQAVRQADEQRFNPPRDA
jgi:hypothetical protein